MSEAREAWFDSIVGKRLTSAQLIARLEELVARFPESARFRNQLRREKAKAHRDGIVAQIKADAAAAAERHARWMRLMTESMADTLRMLAEMEREVAMLGRPRRLLPVRGTDGRIVRLDEVAFAGGYH
jgi:hypothetical protein